MQNPVPADGKVATAVVASYRVAGHRLPEGAATLVSLFTQISGANFHGIAHKD